MPNNRIKCYECKKCIKQLYCKNYKIVYKLININMFGQFINIHKNFILKPNPYVTQEQAEEVYTKFAVG